MRELLADLGHLVACKKINRDSLAESIGTTRQNLISAFKGRRPLPMAQMPPLRQALGLDDDYRFASGRVHGLTVNLGKNRQFFLHNLLRRFLSRPVRGKWLLRGIGEGSRSGFAYVFEDSRGALVAVRNDDALLGVLPDADGREDVLSADVNMVSLFSRADGSPNREITLEDFEVLFAGGMSVDNFRAALACTDAVWTWTRLREKAEQAGLNAESAARALGLC